MLQPGGDKRNAVLAGIQAIVALALLVALPVVVGTPDTVQGMIAAGAVALVLFTFLVTGVARFIRTRRRPFLDSVMPPQKRPDVESTVIKPRREP